MRRAFADGIGWGDAKQRLFERIDAELAPARERYEALIARPEEIEERLLAGAAEGARCAAARFDRAAALGGRRAPPDRSRRRRRGEADRPTRPPLPQMKSYREADGQFYFKLESRDGATLLQSRGFGSPKDAGRLAAALVDAGDDAADARARCSQTRCPTMPRRREPSSPPRSAGSRPTSSRASRPGVDAPSSAGAAAYA